MSIYDIIAENMIKTYIQITFGRIFLTAFQNYF